MTLIGKFHASVFGFHRRTTAPALNKSGEKQGDHLYLSGAPHAHLPLTTLHPPATEESPGTSGEVDTLCTTENMICLTTNQSLQHYTEIHNFQWQELKKKDYYLTVFHVKQFTFHPFLNLIYAFCSY